jgi:hypothetical protein
MNQVATQSRLILTPRGSGRASADVLRLENGKVVEHWDVIQEVLEASANSNGMFLTMWDGVHDPAYWTTGQEKISNGSVAASSSSEDP